VTTISCISRAVIVLLGGLLLLACSRSPDVAYLASDAYYLIANHEIVVPVVAIRGPGHNFDLGGGKTETVQKASDPHTPVKKDTLDLYISQYKYTGELAASIGICPLLKRKWSETWCLGQPNGLLGRLPKQFDLLDRNRLDDLKSHSTVGSERVYDQVKDMAVRPGMTEIGCDARSRFCTAMVEVLPGLLAVWTVWSDETTKVKAEQMAETQGTAIVQFVRRSLGPTEDVTLVNED
jgi:hypothetical protein